MVKLIVKLHITDVKKWVNGPVYQENNGYKMSKVNKLLDNKVKVKPKLKHKNRHKVKLKNKLKKIIKNKMKINILRCRFNKHHKKLNLNKSNQILIHLQIFSTDFISINQSHSNDYIIFIIFPIMFYII